IWVFERYFQNLKRNVESNTEHSHPYVSTSLKPPSGGQLLTSDLLDEVGKHTRVWIHGLPGTGKTEMIHEALRRYSDASSLKLAWKQHGLIPILIPVRDLNGQNIMELARAALMGKGMPFDDAEFFARLLRSGGFLIILDGLNEADLEK